MPKERARRALYLQLAALLYKAAEGHFALVDLDDDAAPMTPLLDFDDAAEKSATAVHRYGYKWGDVLHSGCGRDVLLDVASMYEKKAAGYKRAAPLDVRDAIESAGAGDGMPGKNTQRPAPASTKQLGMFDGKGRAA